MTTQRSDIPRKFFSDDEQKLIIAAIGEAEKRTSGEIRLFLERDVKDLDGDPYARARGVFAELGMHETAQRNGVLVYLAVRSRRFAIVGDENLHQLVGENYWTDVRDLMERHFSAEQFTDGLTAGIAAIAESLGRHFPPQPDDINELPDDIAF
jgi:uncharacterized membrane protein